MVGGTAEKVVAMLITYLGVGFQIPTQESALDSVITSLRREFQVYALERGDFYQGIFVNEGEQVELQFCQDA